MFSTSWMSNMNICVHCQQGRLGTWVIPIGYTFGYTFELQYSNSWILRSCVFHLLEFQMKFCTVVLDIIVTRQSPFPSCVHSDLIQHLNYQTIGVVKASSSPTDGHSLKWSDQSDIFAFAIIHMLTIILFSVYMIPDWPDISAVCLPLEVTSFPPDSHLWILQSPEIKDCYKKNLDTVVFISNFWGRKSMGSFSLVNETFEGITDGSLEGNMSLLGKPYSAYIRPIWNHLYWE